MAGFDFEFNYTKPQEAVVLVCLAAARARARRLGVSWRWRHVSPRQCLVLVDGNSRRMDLLGYRLERDLPLVAEGCSESPLSPAQRARLGRGFVDVMLRRRNSDHYDCVALHGVAATSYYYPPYDFACPWTPNLNGRLSITEDFIVAWNFGEVAAEVLLEELHTACELVLEELVNRRAKKLSFSELVALADGAGHLWQLRGEVPAAGLLEGLKDLRKEVRHRAAPGAHQWIDTHWEDVAICLERLVSRINAARQAAAESKG